MEMVGKQIVEGMDDDHFAPDTNVTRAQFATLIAKVLNLKDSADQIPFDDVASGSWYESTVKKAYAASLINGISEHEFAPEKNITRTLHAVTYSAQQEISKIEYVTVAVGVDRDILSIATALHQEDESTAEKIIWMRLHYGYDNSRTNDYTTNHWRGIEDGKKKISRYGISQRDHAT